MLAGRVAADLAAAGYSSILSTPKVSRGRRPGTRDCSGSADLPERLDLLKDICSQSCCRSSLGRDEPENSECR